MLRFIVVGLAASFLAFSIGGAAIAQTTTAAPSAAPSAAALDPSLPVAGTVGTQAVWRTPAGLVLYVYNGDANGVSNCFAECANVWPPLAAGPSSVATGDFTIISRRDPAGRQWAYRGKPLYTFGPDTAAQATGDGQAGFSYAVIAK